MQQLEADITQHPLLGVQLGNLWKILNENGGIINNLTLSSLLFLLSAMGRLPFTLLEKGMVRIKGPLPSPKAPVIIVGYWRSGTTHIHNLLGQNSNFGIITPIASGLPGELLTLGSWFKGILQHGLPDNRGIDQVAVTIHSPQEDEIPIANLQTLSIYHALYFPDFFERNFYRGVFFDDTTREEIDRWKTSVQLFLGKVARHQKNSCLLLKNPVYTCRMDHVLDMWPDARIIHIHRNPYEVFVSSRNYFKKMLRKLALKPNIEPEIEKIVLESYPRMLHKLYKDTENVSEHRFLEISYEKLVEQPLEQLEMIHERLEIRGWEQAKENTEAYLRTISDYKKNAYRFESSDLRKVEKHWGEFIDRWGYHVPDSVEI